MFDHCGGPSLALRRSWQLPPLPCATSRLATLAANAPTKPPHSILAAQTRAHAHRPKPLPVAVATDSLSPPARLPSTPTTAQAQPASPATPSLRSGRGCWPQQRHHVGRGRPVRRLAVRADGRGRHEDRHQAQGRARTPPEPLVGDAGQTENRVGRVRVLPAVRRLGVRHPRPRGSQVHRPEGPEGESRVACRVSRGVVAVSVVAVSVVVGVAVVVAAVVAAPPRPPRL